MRKISSTLSRTGDTVATRTGMDDLLCRTELFEGLEPAEIAAIFAQAEMGTYSAGSLISMPESDSSERLYAVKEGLVCQYRLTANGKRLVTRYIQPGSVFGIRASLGRVVQENFAEAVEDSIVYIMTRQQVLELLKRRPELAFRFLEMVNRRLYLLEERLVAAAYNPVVFRLAYFLLTNADPKVDMLSNMSHEDIGNAIGAVRQTVTETLGNLKRLGLIEMGSKRIRITDRNGLEQILKG